MAGVPATARLLRYPPPRAYGTSSRLLPTEKCKILYRDNPAWRLDPQDFSGVVKWWAELSLEPIVHGSGYHRDVFVHNNFGPQVGMNSPPEFPLHPLPRTMGVGNLIGQVITIIPDPSIVEVYWVGVNIPY